MINIAFNAFNYNVLHHLSRKNMFKNIFFIAYNSVCFYIYLWQYFLTSTWTISATVRLAQWAKLRGINDRWNGQGAVNLSWLFTFHFFYFAAFTVLENFYWLLPPPAVAGENRCKLRPLAASRCNMQNKKATSQSPSATTKCQVQHIVYNVRCCLGFYFIWESRVLQFLLQLLHWLHFFSPLFFLFFYFVVLHSLLPIFTSLWVVWHFLTAVSQYVKVSKRSQQNKSCMSDLPRPPFWADRRQHTDFPAFPPQLHAQIVVCFKCLCYCCFCCYCCCCWWWCFRCCCILIDKWQHIIGVSLQA